jgi:hypothetical protein
MTFYVAAKKRSLRLLNRRDSLPETRVRQHGDSVIQGVVICQTEFSANTSIQNARISRLK